MLDKNKIKEAESNVRGYLSEGLLRKKEPDKKIIDILIKNYKESIKVANLVYQNNHSDLWAIVCSYYSMYYISNAVLLKFGYKVGEKISHKVTSDALIVFIRNKLKSSLIEDYEEVKEEALKIAGIKADSLLEEFDMERLKREEIQYNTPEVLKHSKANTSIERAKIFNLEMEKLLID